MKKTMFLLLIPLLFACDHKKQSEKSNDSRNTEMFRFDRDSLVIKKIEKQNDALKDQFLKASIGPFKNEYEAYNNEFRSIRDLKKDLHVYDFNADGKDDLIFTGMSGGEPNEVAFILNTTSGFKLVFKTFQYIWNLKLDHHKISALYIYDNGCCASYIDFNKIYHIDYNKDEPEFRLTYLTANINISTFPQKFLSKPVYFEVVNDNYKLRLAPKINDVDSVGYGGELRKGNTIGLLARGTMGRAIAAQKDSTGRVWWFVELNPESKVKESMFYEDDESKKIAGKMGWISSRYVRKLE